MVLDVFDLYVPALAAGSGLVAIQRRTAWGVADEIVLHWRGVPFGRPLPPGSAPLHTAASAHLASWVGLTLAREATESAASASLGARYLEGLRAVLDAHADWLLVVESDCDQHPIARVALTTFEVIERVDAQRRSPLPAFAFEMTPRRGPT